LKNETQTTYIKADQTHSKSSKTSKRNVV